MKLLSRCMIIGMFFMSSAMAATFSVEDTVKIAKRISDLKEIILDVENTCSSGCRYKLSNVREMKLVEKINENHFYTWMYIAARRDSAQYSEVIVKETAPSEMFISSNTPESSTIKRLKEKYGHSHFGIIDRIESNWTLKENFDSNGEFIDTSVKYYNKAISNSALIRLFSGTVRAEMRKTMNEMFSNLKE